MVDVDPVKVAVDIVNNTMDEIAEIRAALEALDLQDIDIDVRANLKEGSFVAARAKAQAMMGDGVLDRRIRMPATGKMMPMRMGGGFPRFGAPPDIIQRRNVIGESGFAVRRLRDKWREFGRTLLRYRPSIMDWWNILALLIPILITLAGAAVGLVAALGGVATAAAAVVGVGLLGWGDSAAQSFANLQERAKMLGSELFNVLQPAANAMQPLVEGAMNALPGMVANLNDELINLSQFGPGLSEIGRGFMEWIEDVLQRINVLRETIIDVALDMGRAFGDFIKEFLTFGLNELARNQEAYERLASIFVDFIAILFELSKLVAFTAAQFDFVFKIGAQVAAAMSGKWFNALITFSTAAFLGGLALIEFAAAMGLSSSMMAGSIPVISTLIGFFGTLWTNIQAAVVALWNFNRALAATGVGAVLVGAGILAGRTILDRSGKDRIRSRGRRGGDVIIEGDVGRREMHKIRDVFPNEYGNESFLSGI